MFWSSLIVVRQPHCCEVASLFWHSLFVVGQPLCCEVSLFLWGSLIVLRQPEFCEVASLLWGWLNIVRQPHCCEGTLREPHFIFAMFSAWIFSFRVPQSPHFGSASTLAVLATFYDSGSNQSKVWSIPQNLKRLNYDEKNHSNPCTWTHSPGG